MSKREVKVKTKDRPFIDYDLRVYFDEGYVVIEETPPRGYNVKEVYIPLSAVESLIQAVKTVAKSQ